MKVGRNKPCHCGSGKKYKHCHEISKKSNNNQYVIVGLVATVIAVVLFMSTDRNESNKRTAISTRPLQNQLAPKSNSKPAGIAPPGKVWHEGHGHWHDAPLAASTPKKTSFNTNNSLARKSRPQGEAPRGQHDRQGHDPPCRGRAAQEARGLAGYSNFLNNRDDVQLNKVSLKIHFKMLNCSKYAIIN